MAVAQTGAIFKALTVDGESSRTYGVYITGQAVYNAPQREVEMISIAGRNGKFALDKGRFENIEVTYPAGIYAETEEDFAEAISDFRNFLCSRDGYVRIEDEYNPNEYRVGVYKSGLEVTPKLLKAGEFEITFDCKPQRWLKSGETAITVASGDVVTNPTLFESSPLLMAEGYGDIEIGGGTISIEHDPMGEVLLKSGFSSNSGTVIVSSINDLLNIGDRIYFKGYGGMFASIKSNSTSSVSVRYLRVTQAVNCYPTVLSDSKVDFSIRLALGTDSTLVYGTEGTEEASLTVTAALSNGRTTHINFNYTLHYSGTTIFTKSITITEEDPALLKVTVSSTGGVPLFGDSTKMAIAQPAYIDLDIGEAYGLIGDTMSSLNNAISLPSDLPKLSSGANTITFDNTITDLKIVPRFWKV